MKLLQIAKNSLKRIILWELREWPMQEAAPGYEAWTDDSWTTTYEVRGHCWFNGGSVKVIEQKTQNSKCYFAFMIFNISQISNDDNTVNHDRFYTSFQNIKNYIWIFLSFIYIYRIAVFA